MKQPGGREKMGVWREKLVGGGGGREGRKGKGGKGKMEGREGR